MTLTKKNQKVKSLATLIYKRFTFLVKILQWAYDELLLLGTLRRNCKEFLKPLLEEIKRSYKRMKCKTTLIETYHPLVTLAKKDLVQKAIKTIRISKATSMKENLKTLCTSQSYEMKALKTIKLTLPKYSLNVNRD